MAKHKLYVPKAWAKQAVAEAVKWISDYFDYSNPGCNAIVGISGGKDSSIVAALCVKALGRSRVIGVKMPQGAQHDISSANELIDFLKIKSIEINIGQLCTNAYESIEGAGTEINSVISTNFPARMRMAILYSVAAGNNGRVANTSNRSENYIGYFTKFGDGVGDFSPIVNFTVTELLAIGEELGLPDNLLYKDPEDGMTGKLDEEIFGFTYDSLDRHILGFEECNCDEKTIQKMEDMNKRSQHKLTKSPEFYMNPFNFKDEK